MNRSTGGRVWTTAILALVGICFCVLCIAGLGLAWWRSISGTEGGPEFLPLPTVTVEAGKPARPTGGTLRLVGGDPITLDPALVEDSISASYVNKIFAGLVSLDAHLEVQPELAEGWEVDATGTQYTFYLRPDARFQDGRAVRAEDVKFSLERACDPRTGSPVAALYLGDIVGAMERIAGVADEIRGVEVLDERTLRLTIDAPKAYFLAKLTYPSAAVVDSQNVLDANWTERPNGSGPYRLSKRTDDEIVLSASTTYFRGTPGITQLSFNLSAGDPTTMYENDELDVAPVGIEDLERVLDPSNPLHAELVTVPQLTVQYAAFNTRLEPFDDKNIRLAFVYATDREKLAEVMFKRSVVPAWGILPPGLPGYSPDVPRLAYDPERARQLLAQSRYGGPAGLPPIVFAVSAGGSRIAEALAAMYEDTLGVKIEIQQVEWGDFLRDINQGAYQMFLLGWSADYPDPQNFLDIHFHSASDGNSTGYRNPEVDALLERARVEQDEEQRFALYRQAEAIIVQDAPWIPLYHGVQYELVKPYVKGLVITPQGEYDVSSAYIEGAR
ncbi:MAG: peptide ABC transporter substrate-binding protein [Anaerolineae bacterium]